MMKKQAVSKEQSSRGTAGSGQRPGLRALGEAIDGVTRPLLRGGRQRLLAAELAAAWPEIVGAGIAAISHPDRLVFPPMRRAEGMLHLTVDSGAAALELQHRQRLVCERINTYLGFTAVVRLKLVQGPLPARRVPSGSHVPTAAAPSADGPEISLAGIDGDRLRQALAGLGRRLGRPPASD